MTAQPLPLENLLEQINSGHAADALPELDRLQTLLPGNLAVLTLRAEALRQVGRSAEAIEAYRHAGQSGAGARNWLVAGVLLAAERNIPESLRCLNQALVDAPDNDEILDALITALFNNNRYKEGIEFARRQLALSTRPQFLSRAALLLQANDLYEESAQAFKNILQLAPDDPTLIGAALVAARFTCEWEWIESLQQRICALYDQGDFASPQEYPLTHITWCADEARNLGVTRAYVARMVPRVEPLPPQPVNPPGRRIRVGYLSSDFRNHATMHLLAGVLEHHDRGRFEVFAYDYTSPDVSVYRQRFLDTVEHHVPILSMSDRQAAERIAADRLDILFDLKLYTGGARSIIMAHRPCALQATYLGFPGSAASPDIDYVVSDRFVTPDSSAPFYTEKFCRLPHSYQCNDRKRSAAANPVARIAHGLPEGRIIFGAFNQSYKIDPSSFAVWMRILHEVPDSVLWLLGQSEAARNNLTRHAQLAGIDPARIIYAPFADPREHLSRLQLADAVLDALVCNGHTTTSDALWAGVPVITARGRHFASRVSESLLNAMELSELVGADVDDMVRIARRVGTDAPYRAELRARVAANRHTAPLFDTERFTRNFEAAIEMMVAHSQSGLPPDHIDVPDRAAVDDPAPRPVSAGRDAQRHHDVHAMKHPMHIMVLCWQRVMNNVLEICRQLEHFDCRKTVLDVSGLPHRVVPGWEWIAIDPRLYYGGQFGFSLQLVNAEVYLSIVGDMESDDWTSVASTCAERFAQFAELGVWSAEVDNTAWPTSATGLCAIQDTGLTAVAQTDCCVWALRRPIVDKLRKLDFTLTNFGWGIDWAAAVYCYTSGYIAVRDIAASIHHPQGTGYSSTEAPMQQERFLGQLTASEQSVLQSLQRSIRT